MESEKELLVLDTQNLLIRLANRAQAISLLADYNLYEEAQSLLSDAIAIIDQILNLISIEAWTEQPQFETLKNNLLETVSKFKTTQQAGDLDKVVTIINKLHRLASKRFVSLRNKQWATASFIKEKKKNFSIILTIVLITCLAIIIPTTSYLYSKYSTYRTRQAFIKNKSSERMVELQSISIALKAYFAKNGKYPKTNGWLSANNCWGQSTLEWIPELVPGFLSSLPVEKNPIGCERQYMYFSDGKNYKLISRKPPDHAIVTKLFPELIDPTRASLAYGYWSPGGVNF